MLASIKSLYRSIIKTKDGFAVIRDIEHINPMGLEVVDKLQTLHNTPESKTSGQSLDMMQIKKTDIDSITFPVFVGVVVGRDLTPMEVTLIEVLEMVNKNKDTNKDTNGKD